MASDLTEEISGTLEVGCLVTLAPLVMARVRQTFMRAYPGVDIAMKAGQDELMSLLHLGRRAMALTYDLELAADVIFHELASLPPYALLAADHALAGHGEVTLAELSEVPLVLLDLPLSRDYFHGLFLAAGAEPNLVQRTPLSSAGISCEAHGPAAVRPERRRQSRGICRGEGRESDPHRPRRAGDRHARRPTAISALSLSDRAFRIV